MQKNFYFLIASFLISLFSFGFYARKDKLWQTVNTQNEPQARGENGFVRVKDKFYLLGGRKERPVEAYDPKTQTWEKKAAMPLEMHHFQAVVYQNEIYILGAFTGNYPHETPIPRIYIYNPPRNEWREGPLLPEGRHRGSAGAVLYKNKIYLVSGIIDGHYDGHVAWFDEFDPATSKWRTLPDIPHARDHVSVAVADGQLVVAGGRKTTARTNQVVNLTVPEVDIFDFSKNAWTTLPANLNIPTQRAGNAAVTFGRKILIIGGESTQKVAHNQTEAFDIKTRAWETWAPLKTGRHATQAFVYKNKVYIAAGTGNQGGSPELNSLEVME